MKKALLLGGIFISLCVMSHAQTISFTGAAGTYDGTHYDYANAANWSGGVLPSTTTGATALLNSGGAVTYSGSIGDLMYSNGGKLEVSSGSFTQITSGAWIQLGQQGAGASTGNGTILVDGGTFNQGTSSNSPFNITGTGNSFIVTKGAANLNNGFNVNSGLTYTQSGGVVTSSAGNATINSSYSQSGGTFTISNANGNFSQNGTFLLSAGTLNVNNTGTVSSTTSNSEFDFNNASTTISGGLLNTPLITGVNGGGTKTLTFSGGTINLGDRHSGTTANDYLYGGGSTAYINFTTGSTASLVFEGGISAATVTGMLSGGGIEYNGASSPSAFVVTTGTNGIIVSLAQTGSTTNGLWTSASTGDWGNTANWAGGAAPGLNPSFTNTDTATFGLVPSGAANVTVNITTPSPSLSTINFDSPNSYNIALGTGGTNLTLSSSTGTATINTQVGSHTISAPVVLASNTTINAAGGTSLGISGAVSGSGNLAVAGGGTVTLSGSNSFTGTTDVSGNLKLAAAGSAGSTTQVTVENGGSLIFGSSATPTTGALNSSANVLLAGGGTITTNGSHETFGTLTLIGSGTAQLDLTSTTASGVLLTIAGNGSIWSSNLNINSWSDGTNGTTQNEIAASNLNSNELSHITWSNVTLSGTTYNSLSGASIVGGILTPGASPAPEPSTVFGSICLLGLIAWRQRRQLAKISLCFLS